MFYQSVPVVKNRLTIDSWQICFYEEFEPILFPNNNIHSHLVSIIDVIHSNQFGGCFRREVVINSFPFLCAFFPQEKALFIGTRHLSRELSLLKIYEATPLSSDQRVEKIFFNLKDHVEKISTMPVNTFLSELNWVTLESELPDFSHPQWLEVDEKTRIIYRKLIDKVKEYHASLFEKLSDFGLSLTAQFELIRLHLLKFLALLPSLDHDHSGKEVKSNLTESLRRLIEDSKLLSLQKKRGKKPIPSYLFYLSKFAFFAAHFLPTFILAKIVRFSVKTMAKRFIAGESINRCHNSLKNLRSSGREATLDQLGELVVSNLEADEYFQKVLQLIYGLKEHVSRGEKNKAGLYCAHVSIKVSALSHDLKPEAFDYSYSKVAPRLKRILQEAKREEVFINIDAEHYIYRDLIFAIYQKVLLETPELKDFAQTGIVIQAYLRDGAKHLLDVISLAKERSLRMPIRLVKGAYWDAETIEAQAHQFTPPQFLNKEESDLHFRQLTWLSLKHHENIHLSLASHNIQDHAFAEALREIHFPQAPIIEHQCLHMTYEGLSQALAKMGWPTRNYMPVGNLLVGMAYLVRRIMENSSQVGVLSIMRSHKKASSAISPVEVHEKNKKNGTLNLDLFLTQLKSDFTPTRPLKLHKFNERCELELELKSLHNRIEEKQLDWKNSSLKKISCSSKPNLVVGTVKENTSTDAIKSIDELEFGLSNSWWSKKFAAPFRVSVMLKAADKMLLQRNRLAALIMYEAGKTMNEALADVDEAIDFLQFYARQEIAVQLSQEKFTNRGVFAVIAPWNFPLAIPCGMTVAPLVAGNAVVLKPAEQTPLIGKELYDLLIDAGVPQDIFRLIIGEGEVVGAPLVTHEKTAGIVFTGSKSVGTWIYRHGANKVLNHYHYQFPMQKKVITEMGGKNAIVVTNNCEMDETISGILYSAFGHAGQKCSATSRVIVHKQIKQVLVNRLINAIKDLQIGESLDPSSTMNPLITAEDHSRVLKIVEQAKDEVIKVGGKILVDRSFEKLPGFCIGPTLLEIPPHQARKKESWAQKEIFGPVIHIIEFDSLVEAVELFNATDYALTGGIYSQSQDDIDFLSKFLRAGNIYVNRPNTGARVAIEPFGGFKLSGTGPKAGGGDYIREFHFPIHQVIKNRADVTWAKDSGYQLMIPRPSLISIQGRISRFLEFSSLFLVNFESLMGEVNEKDKTQLGSLTDWIKQNLAHYLHNKHSNFRIPGQISFNDKNLVKDSGLFVVVSPFPSLKCMNYLFAALSLGCGLSIACVSEEAFKTWSYILNLCWKSGFSKVNVDCTLTSPESLRSIYKKSHFSFVYAGDLNSVPNFYRDIFEDQALSEYMRVILSDIDGTSLIDPTYILDHFVWTRSFAINTMRHGASLEIDS